MIGGTTDAEGKELKRDEVLRYMINFATKHHRTPSYGEIGIAFRVSRVRAKTVCDELVSHGKISRDNFGMKVVGATYVPPAPKK